MHPFERHMLARFVAALAGDGGEAWARWWRTTELSHWMRRHHRLIGLPALPCGGEDPGAAENLAARDMVHRHLARRPMDAAPRPSALERRLSWLGDEMGLDATSRSILGLLTRFGASPEFHSLSLAISGDFLPERLLLPINRDVPVLIIASALRLSTSLVLKHLAPGKPLRMFDLVEDRHRHDYAAGPAALKVAASAHAAPDRLRHVLLGAPRATALKWEDFADLGADAETVATIVEAAAKGAACGVNILLHGAPGTGKTAFACALAARLGLRAVFIGESREDGDEPDRDERIGALALAQRLARNMKGLLLVVDEADDLFVGVDDQRGGDRRGAKVFMNNLVEASPAPTLYISNHPGRLGPAVLRRMTYAISFPDLDRPARARIVRRAAARHRLSLTEEAVQALSRLDAPPALLDHGLQAARLCKGGGEIALRATVSLLKAMDRPHAAADQPQPAFAPAFACADADLEHLTARIAASGRTDISLCLSGPPGTGKSAYARHLAARMGLEVVVKRASDLLGMFVGQSEKNIAACFREAQAKRAFLIFDEADSLLRDRAGARHGFEIQQVNEMLTWMERHPYRFACTTNFAEGLDAAAARRFLFKVKFRPLDRAQARALFRHSFGLEAPARLDALDQLTPGDFAVVARKAQVLQEQDADRLVAALCAEQAERPGALSRPIGFRAGAEVRR